MMLWARAQPMLIPFAGPPGHFPQISFAQVVQGNYAPGTFDGRFVLIGATATGMGDALPTPVSGFSHSMSGVEINANVLAALLDGIHITPLARGWQLVLAGSLALLPLLLFPHMAPRTNLLVTAGLLAATIALTGVLLVGAHQWFPPAAALLAIALSYPLWNWRRLELAMRYLNQELDRLKEQQAPMVARQASSLEASLDFLQHVLPVDGWCLRGPGGSMVSQRGQVPRPPPDAVRAGIWQASAAALWTRLQHRGREQDLGLYWRGDGPPDVQQAAVLGQLLEQFSDPAPITEAGGHEIVRDRIRQVQQAAAELRELRRLVEDSLSNMADGILATNALGEVVLSNTRAGWYLRGDDDADLRGQPVMALLGDLQIRDDENWEDLLRRSLLENARNLVETRLAGGRQLLVQVAPLSRDQQQPGGLVLNFSDITPLKASENKRTELLNFLSHDLRSPLVSIVALLELAREKDSTGAIRDLLARMENHAGKTLELADQFLQLARIESGSELNLRDLDLAAVAVNAVEQVWEHARVKRIRIEKNIAREDAWIHGEGSLLERALVNLLGNAIKYSEPDSTVRLELHERGEEWHCCVSDEGEGIPRTEIPRLFDRFQRIYRKNRPAQSGAGLGLAFVQAVAGIHGGHIEVESTEGEGSRFCLVLPRQER
jgi:signal transduction histidine kinase